MFSVLTAALTICVWAAVADGSKATQERTKASKSAGSRLNLSMERRFLSVCRTVKSPSWHQRPDKFRGDIPECTFRPKGLAGIGALEAAAQAQGQNAPALPDSPRRAACLTTLPQQASPSRNALLACCVVGATLLALIALGHDGRRIAQLAVLALPMVLWLAWPLRSARIRRVRTLLVWLWAKGFALGGAGRG